MLPAHNFPIFVDYYAMFVLVCHSVKKGLYAFFKSHRKEWNNMADREEMEEHIVQNLGFEIPPDYAYFCGVVRRQRRVCRVA